MEGSVNLFKNSTVVYLWKEATRGARIGSRSLYIRYPIWDQSVAQMPFAVEEIVYKVELPAAA